MNNNSVSSRVNIIKEINLLNSPIRKSQFVLKINLDEGKTENLYISQISNPEELAYNFCLKHNLDFESVKQLINKIVQFKKDNNFISDKENLSLSSNVIKNKKSSQSLLGNCSLNNKKYINKKSIIYNSHDNINKNNDDIENRKNKENYTTKKIFINSNNMTPIIHASIYSKNNIENTSDKNLNFFNYLSPKVSNNDKLTNNNSSNINKIINDNNIKLDYSKKTSKENSNNNSLWTCNFNDSINDKINNLEKAYVSFNPKNKKLEVENKDISNDDFPGNTKEIISEAIKDCLNIVEKEENINNKNNETITESIYSIERKDIELKDKKLLNEINTVNAETIKNKSSLLDKSEDNFNMKNSYITPKDKKMLNFNSEKLTEDNNDIISGNINENLNEVNAIKKSLISKNNAINDDAKSINDNFFENKNGIIDIEKNISIKGLLENNYSNNKKLIPKISISNNNIINTDNFNHNLDGNCLDAYNNNNYNLDYYDTQYENDNNINLKIIDNNNIIQKEINFSLLSNKNNFTISYSHKDFNNKKSFRRVLQKNQVYYRSYREKVKKNEIIGTNNKKNSVKDNSNSNSFSYNNMNKDSLLSDNNNIYNIKGIKNFSSLKTIINTDNDKKILYSPMKIDKSINKCCLLSFTRSEKNMVKIMNKNNKNKDNLNNRATTTSIGNYTNNYSTITRGSTNIKLINHKNLINYNILNKIPLNHTFNFSNELLFKRQKEKEKDNNSYYNNTINNSHNLYYTNFVNNKKSSIKSNKSNNAYKIKNKKNKRIIFLSNLNLNNSIKTNYSINKDNSPDYLKQKTKSNLSLHYKNISKMKLDKETKCNHNSLNKNSLTQNLLAKKEIMNSLKKMFYHISKNNNTLDVFAVVNKKNIPENIYYIIKNIVKNCDKKKRFIEYEEFINKAFYIYDSFSKEDKITVLNFNQINP